jgi:hypothetical protein
MCQCNAGSFELVLNAGCKYLDVEVLYLQSLNTKRSNQGLLIPFLLLNGWNHSYSIWLLLNNSGSSDARDGEHLDNKRQTTAK